MHKIEVDDDVMEALKTLAEPFVDTPNSVLRRILKPNVESRKSGTDASVLGVGRANSRNEVRTKHFVEGVLATEFGRDFNRRGRFTYMFENRTRLVYFQNFNASYDNAWYRIGESPREEIRRSGKEAFLCLTVPAEGDYYLIPYQDILERVQKVRWTRPDLEVNIDRIRSTWRELKWDLTPYKKHLHGKN